MGTLFYPDVRKNCDVSAVNTEKELIVLKNIAKKNKTALSAVIEVRKILEEKRKNDLFVCDRKAWDEQIAGLGEILEKIYLNFEWSVD